MKKLKPNKRQLFAFGIISTLIAFTFLLTSFDTTSDNNSEKEKQFCYGPTITSKSRENQECWMCNNDPDPHECIRGGNREWCFGVYTVTVSAPKGWYFTGEPTLNCVKDNDGSFGWNMGYINHMKITERTPNFIKATIYLSSKSIQVNLKCEATKD